MWIECVMYSYTQMWDIFLLFYLFFSFCCSNFLKSCTYSTQSKEENISNLASYRSCTLLAQLSFTAAVISKQFIFQCKSIGESCFISISFHFVFLCSPLFSRLSNPSEGKLSPAKSCLWLIESLTLPPASSAQLQEGWSTQLLLTCASV